MASVDILTLSSSPPRPFRAFSISSSPVLPSPRDLFQKKRSLLQTASGLDSVSHNAASLSKPTLATVLPIDRPSPDMGLSLELGPPGNGIVQINESADANMSSIPKSDCIQEVDSLPKTRKKKSSKPEDISIDSIVTKKRRQKNTDGDLIDLVAKLEKPARKPRSRKTDKPTGEDGLKEKAPRKPRTKKTDGDAQTKMPQLHVTKPATSSELKTSVGAAKSTKPEVVSRHFSTAEFSNPPKASLSNGLLEAVKRRTCWTPPKPTVEPTCVTTQISDVADDMNGLLECASLEENNRGFSDLFGKFAFSSIQAPISGRNLSDGSGMKKRKFIEMLPTTGSTSNTATAAPKVKAPKKKARTITDQATSAYNHEESLSTTPAPLQYFSSETANSGTKDGFKIPSKPRAKKPAKPSSKRDKGTAHAPILLSPGSALKQVGNQDFVFGTSSQLAREESPTFLRNIHAAMQASNEVDEDDPFIDSFQTSTVTPIRTEENPVLLAKRNLWSAAARDTSGKLLNIQMVDLANSPATTTIDVNSFVKTAPIDPIISNIDSIWHDIEELVVDEVVPETRVIPIQPPKLPVPLEPPSLSINNLMGPGLSPRALRMPQSSDTIPHVTQSTSTNNLSTAECDPDKPDYSSYTSAELAKEIASYRFKPVKNRNQMIGLLERCWEGKKRTALGSLQANALLHSSSSNPVEKSPLDQPETLSPKRPRGRPRTTTTSIPQKVKAKKTVSSTTTAVGHSEPHDGTTRSKAVLVKKTRKKTKELVDEISDSDSPLTPSPPRRRPSQIGTPPLPLQTASPTAVDESPTTALASSPTRLFEHITRAVTNAPRSKDPTNPSWHEKILLYDPIILEDLTVWLNTGALEKAGWDGEIHPGEVKKWCISKSICCLWKENLRGGVRTRY